MQTTRSVVRTPPPPVSPDNVNGSSSGPYHKTDGCSKPIDFGSLTSVNNQTKHEISISLHSNLENQTEMCGCVCPSRSIRLLVCGSFVLPVTCVKVKSGLSFSTLLRWTVTRHWINICLKENVFIFRCWKKSRSPEAGLTDRPTRHAKKCYVVCKYTNESLSRNTG